MPLYFGLGDAAQADEVEILWPSGKKQVLSKEIPTNALLRVTEEGGR